MRVYIIIKCITRVIAAVINRVDPHKIANLYISDMIVTYNVFAVYKPTLECFECALEFKKEKKKKTPLSRNPFGSVRIKLLNFRWKNTHARHPF